ncbi:hypothetical protein U9M48_009289 [Paspalum notatum var. saurae]|uniref:Protein FAR1-RELATED SEQUENCE n=1 Tax=Paspalum notatum var. saurae TaxID=547442 RepID=A0AAQ3SRD0_PASNO
MHHHKDPYVILTYEDTTMKIVIQSAGNTKIDIYKEKIEALLNWPQQPSEFEAAWTDTVKKFSIADNPAIEAFWNKRHMFIASYFKENYCGRLTSTQRSESTNNMLKSGFLNNATSMNMPAKQCYEALQHVDHLAGEETHYSQTPNMHNWMRNSTKLTPRECTRNTRGLRTTQHSALIHTHHWITHTWISMSKDKGSSTGSNMLSSCKPMWQTNVTSAND